MIKEEFSNGNSMLHTLDPRVKIIVALLFSVVVAFSMDINVLFFASIFSLILLLLSKIALKRFFKRIFFVNGFIIFLWFFLPFTYPGRELFRLGPLSATFEGLYYSLMITVKSNIIITAYITLLSTSSITALIHALNHLYCPDKLIQIFLFNYRYIHVLHQEYQKLKDALKVKCFKPRSNIRTYKTYASLFATLLLKSYDRAERVYKAMLCRGFKGKYYVLDHFHITWKDYTAGATMIIFILGMVLCEWIPKIL